MKFNHEEKVEIVEMFVLYEGESVCDKLGNKLESGEGNIVNKGTLDVEIWVEVHVGIDDGRNVVRHRTGLEIGCIDG